MRIGKWWSTYDDWSVSALFGGAEVWMVVRDQGEERESGVRSGVRNSIEPLLRAVFHIHSGSPARQSAAQSHSLQASASEQHEKGCGALLCSPTQLNSNPTHTHACTHPRILAPPSPSFSPALKKFGCSAALRVAPSRLYEITPRLHPNACDCSSSLSALGIAVAADGSRRQGDEPGDSSFQRRPKPLCSAALCLSLALHSLRR